MRIPPYWSKGTFSDLDRNGKRLTFSAWGWSFESPQAAAEDGAARARRAFARITEGEKPESYDYLDRPLREEIVDSVTCDGEIVGLVTRNRYGSLILNAPHACFVDVDFPLLRPQGWWDAVLLGLSRGRRRQRMKSEREVVLQSVRDWAATNPRRSGRLYRTAAGLRLLLVDGLYDPLAAETAALLEALGSDALYRRLTLKQECFRARLTPKPWRCGCPRPPYCYPWETAAAEAAHRRWQSEYEAAARPYATCRLVEEFGAPAANGQIAAIVDFHDRFTLRDPQAMLA